MIENNYIQSQKVAYVEQEPFILSDTVKNNICFGLVYEDEKFKKVCEDACLVQDLKQLAKGQNTLIGERGINLSGGQKVRVSFARALYSQAQILLLDDPFSAVDQQVAQDLIETCINGVLKNKTRIVVTHRLNLLEHAHKILLLAQGTQQFYGTLEDFHRKNYDLAQIAKVIEGRSDSYQSGQNKDQTENQTKEEEEQDKLNLNLIEEERHSHRLSCKDVTSFTKYSCGCFTLPFIFISSLIPALLNLWVSQWVRIWMDQTPDQILNLYYPLLFGVFSLLLIASGILRGFAIITLTLYQGKALHNHMLQRLVRAPVHFFDSNPVGRILNRFSKDIGAVDLVLYYLTDVFFQLYMRVFTILILVCALLPILLIVLAFFISMLLLVRFKAMRLTNATMQLELISRSPIATALGASIQGLPTIRAYFQQGRFLSDFNNQLEKNLQAYFTFVALSRALGFYLDFLCFIFSVVTVFVSFVFRNNSNALSLALAIQILFDNLNNFQYGTRISSELQNYMTSVTRCLEYAKLKSEAELIVPHNSILSCDWPNQGAIEFRSVTMRYRADLKPALNNLTLAINPKAKVGIVGRTGAGKSSILQCLFRMRELDQSDGGQILIDGVDISTLGLHKLRLALSIVPQAPFILQGTVRQNLLLFHEREDIDSLELWEILEAVELKQHIQKLPGKLDGNCSDTNSVFSVGQKQLLSLARAILQKRRILVFDEPTANVDMATDRIVQRVIREKFKDCTVLTIAHRIDTIIDSDDVIVMGEGHLLQQGPPYELLVLNSDDITITRDGPFAQIVKATKGEAQTLFEKAKEHYMKKRST